MPRVSRTLHLPEGWTVSLYDNGAVQVQESGKRSVTLPPEVVEAMDDLRE